MSWRTRSPHARPGYFSEASDVSCSVSALTQAKTPSRSSPNQGILFGMRPGPGTGRTSDTAAAAHGTNFKKGQAAPRRHLIQIALKLCIDSECKLGC